MLLKSEASIRPVIRKSASIYAVSILISLEKIIAVMEYKKY